MSLSYEQQVWNMAESRIRGKVLDVSIDGDIILVHDEKGVTSYAPNVYGPDIGIHEIPVTYLRQYHFVAGSAVQGLVVTRNGRPDPTKWRRLSQYCDRVGRSYAS